MFSYQGFQPRFSPASYLSHFETANWEPDRKRRHSFSFTHSSGAREDWFCGSVPPWPDCSWFGKNRMTLRHYANGLGLPINSPKPAQRKLWEQMETKRPLIRGLLLMRLQCGEVLIQESEHLGSSPQQTHYMTLNKYISCSEPRLPPICAMKGGERWIRHSLQTLLFCDPRMGKLVAQLPFFSYKRLFGSLLKCPMQGISTSEALLVWLLCGQWNTWFVSLKNQ